MPTDPWGAGSAGFGAGQQAADPYSAGMMGQAGFPTPGVAGPTAAAPRPTAPAARGGYGGYAARGPAATAAPVVPGASTVGGTFANGSANAAGYGQGYGAAPTMAAQAQG